MSLAELISVMYKLAKTFQAQQIWMNALHSTGL
jgi:hypothetical protein